MALVPQSKFSAGSRGDNRARAPALRDGRRQFSSTSDDSALVNQILLTDKSHDRPYEVSSLAVKNILQTIEAILSRVMKSDTHGSIVLPVRPCLIIILCHFT